MMQADRQRNNERIRAAIGVAALHALLGYAFITGLGVQFVQGVTQNLKVFDVAVAPPPPPIEDEVPAKTDAPEGAAAPPNLKAKPSPVVAPPPKVKLPVPPPIVAAPAPGTGSDTSAGASDKPGPGTGAGGVGTGTGSGGEGTGTGGGIGARARLVKGRITNSDYPRAAADANAGGSVTVRFTIGTDGRVRGCTVTKSSGRADLDSTTCRLIEKRFRYKPARDAQGRPVESVTGWRQVWWLEGPGGRPPPPDGA